MKTPREKDNRKARTPSGTVILNRATDIRGYFENEIKKLVSADISKISQPELGNYTSASATFKQLSVPKLEAVKRLKVNRSQSVSSIVRCVKTRREAKPQQIQGDTAELTSNTDEQYFTPPSTPTIKGSKKLFKELKRANSTKANTLIVKNSENRVRMPDQRMETDIKTASSSPRHADLASVRDEVTTIMAKVQEHQTGILDNQAEVMNIRAVMAMFTEVKNKLDEVCSRTTEEGSDFRRIDTKVNALERHAAPMSEVNAIKKELEHYKLLTKVQGGTLQRMNDMMDEISGRLDNIELNSNKRMITLSNLPLDEDKDLATSEIQQFLMDSLGIYPEIENFFKIGSAMPPTIVITLAHLQEKQWIMKNKAALKGIKTGGKQHYIQEYLPVSINEKRRREREIKNMYAESETGYRRGKLTIRGQYYKPVIVPPVPEDVVCLSMTQLDNVLMQNIANGNKFVVEGNEFLGFAAKINSHQQIKDMYLKLRIIHPKARHIMCAYIMDKNINDPENKNFCDDGEIAAGRQLLELLEINQLENTVLFVIRYFGDNKIGQNRFACINKAAVSALEKSGYIEVNSANVEMQMNQPQQRQAELNAIRGRYNNRGRGTTRRPYYPARGIRPSYKTALTRLPYRTSSRSNTRRYSRGSTPYRGSYTRGRAHSRGENHASFVSQSTRKRQRSTDNHSPPFHFAPPAQLNGTEPNGRRYDDVEEEYSTVNSSIEYQWSNEQSSDLGEETDGNATLVNNDGEG